MQVSIMLKPKQITINESHGLKINSEARILVHESNNESLDKTIRYLLMSDTIKTEMLQLINCKDCYKG